MLFSMLFGKVFLVCLLCKQHNLSCLPCEEGRCEKCILPRKSEIGSFKKFSV